MDTYRLQVAGLERDLPVCPLGNGVSIAGFVMFSDDHCLCNRAVKETAGI